MPSQAISLSEAKNGSPSIVPPSSDLSIAVDKVEVLSEADLGYFGQVVLVDASVGNVDIANESIPLLTLAIQQALNKANSNSETYIALFRLRIVDERGQILLSYTQDMQTKIEQWSSVEGLLKLVDGPPPAQKPIDSIQNKRDLAS